MGDTATNDTSTYRRRIGKSIPRKAGISRDVKISDTPKFWPNGKLEFLHASGNTPRVLRSPYGVGYSRLDASSDSIYASFAPTSFVTHAHIHLVGGILGRPSRILLRPDPQARVRTDGLALSKWRSRENGDDEFPRLSLIGAMAPI